MKIMVYTPNQDGRGGSYEAYNFKTCTVKELIAYLNTIPPEFEVGLSETHGVIPLHIQDIRIHQDSKGQKLVVI